MSPTPPYGLNMLFQVLLWLLAVTWLDLLLCILTGRWLHPAVLFGFVSRPASPADVRRDAVANALLAVALGQFVLVPPPAAGLLDPRFWITLLAFASCIVGFVIISQGVQRVPAMHRKSQAQPPLSS